MAPVPPTEFRFLRHAPYPAEGELWIQAGAEHGDCRALALLVFDRGLGSLKRGGADIRRIVVHSDPTFDELLALHFAQKLMCGESLTTTWRRLAQYAAEAREGLRPARSIPVEQSLEAVFLFVRGDAAHGVKGGSLEDPDAGRRFLREWEPIAQRLDAAAADPLFDPFAMSPLAGDPAFNRARNYLTEDEATYHADTTRGQIYRAHAPELGDCAALLLRTPRSKMFKLWARADASAPIGDGYRLLIVDGGDGNWVISTDPRKYVSLQVLCERLQMAEVQFGNGATGRWFDGKPFRHTLIAAPAPNGSRLSEEQILRVVRGWASLRKAKPKSGPEPVAASEPGSAWKRYAFVLLPALVGPLLNFTLFRTLQPAAAASASQSINTPGSRTTGSDK